MARWLAAQPRVSKLVDRIDVHGVAGTDVIQLLDTPLYFDQVGQAPQVCKGDSCSVRRGPARRGTAWLTLVGARRARGSTTTATPLMAPPA